MNSKPENQIIIIAGPNGAGKSTLAPHLLRDRLGLMEYVNADTIAQGLSAFQPELDGLCLNGYANWLNSKRALLLKRLWRRGHTLVGSISFAEMAGESI